MQTVHAIARTITQILQLIEVSYIPTDRMSITLRVQICRRHKVRHKNRCKFTKKSERQKDLEIFSYFCSINLKSNTMTTITLSYNERNKTAQAVVKFLESLGIFKILKDDEPNATTIKAIEEVKTGKTYKASSLQDMLNYLRN